MARRMRPTYVREAFELIDMPEHAPLCTLYMNARDLPIKFALHPKAEVTVFCDGTIETKSKASTIWTGVDGTFGITTEVGNMHIESLNGPLILEAADRLGMTVGHACAPDCKHRSR